MNEIAEAVQGLIEDGLKPHVILMSPDKYKELQTHNIKIQDCGMWTPSLVECYDGIPIVIVNEIVGVRSVPAAKEQMLYSKY